MWVIVNFFWAFLRNKLTFANVNLNYIPLDYKKYKECCNIARSNINIRNIRKTKQIATERYLRLPKPLVKVATHLGRQTTTSGHYNGQPAGRFGSTRAYLHIFCQVVNQKAGEVERRDQLGAPSIRDHADPDVDDDFRCIRHAFLCTRWDGREACERRAAQGGEGMREHEKDVGMARHHGWPAHHSSARHSIRRWPRQSDCDLWVNISS